VEEERRDHTLRSREFPNPRMAFPTTREVKPWVQREKREGDVRLVEGREEWEVTWRECGVHTP
jgi:hypothetical protein